MQNPCELCKKKNKCLGTCFPKKAYLPDGATLGSLFDGISGFNVCWARIHGAECCRWSSEIEQFPIAVTKKHFGDEEAGKEGDFEKFFGRNKKENV